MSVKGQSKKGEIVSGKRGQKISYQNVNDGGTPTSWKCRIKVCQSITKCLVWNGSRSSTSTAVMLTKDVQQILPCTFWILWWNNTESFSNILLHSVISYSSCLNSAMFWNVTGGRRRRRRRSRCHGVLIRHFLMGGNTPRIEQNSMIIMLLRLKSQTSRAAKKLSPLSITY